MHILSSLSSTILVNLHCSVAAAYIAVVFALHHSPCVRPLHICTGVAFESWRPQGLTRCRFCNRLQVSPSYPSRSSSSQSIGLKCCR